VPLAWDELTARGRPERHTVRTVPRRLAALGEDPWRGYAEARRPLGKTRVEAVGALARPEGRARPRPSARSAGTK
jgi:bifunctional non-homologous end joining protein LigD